MTAGINPVCELWGEALRALKLRWWRWALSEISPTHPDVPLIVRRIRELEAGR